MALPSSGTITMGMIRTELKQTGAISLGSSECRKLAGVSSGAIKMSDFYGKSNGYYIKFVPWVYDVRTVTTGTNTTSIGTLYSSTAQTTSNIRVLKYSGNVSSNNGNISIEVREGSSYHMGTILNINGGRIEFVHKKFTVTRKVNGGSAITTTYTVGSNNAYTVSEGSALCFRGIANGAVVELLITV